jgi:type II secretory pathway pseudopilin PulG
MYRREGFTVVELIITLCIMVILVTLSTVQLLGSLAEARDEERRTDVMNIITFQEGAYNRNNGVYFPDNSATTTPLIEAYYTNVDRDNLRAPGVVAPNYSLVEATNTTQTAAGVTPRPTKTTYVYQSLTNTGTECKTPATSACRKFNIYYLQETDDTVQMLSSKNQ